MVVTFEACNQSLMDTVLHFLAEERAKLREAAAEKEAADTAAGTGLPPSGHASDAAGGDGPAGGLQLDYQRKVTPSERAVLLADVLDDVDEAVQGEVAVGVGVCGNAVQVGMHVWGVETSECGAPGVGVGDAPHINTYRKSSFASAVNKMSVAWGTLLGCRPAQQHAHVCTGSGTHEKHHSAWCHNMDPGICMCRWCAVRPCWHPSS